MIFINTRPANRAQPLTSAMQDKGMTVIELPLLELVPVAISDGEQQYQQDFCQQPNCYQALVVVSPTAAQLGLASCPQGFVPKCPVIAVGHATAEVLRVAGWQVQCPDEYSNEGMMRMPELNTLAQGDKVLVWRGRGGRRQLVHFLHGEKVTVDAIAWYQRRCPPDALQNFKAMQRDIIESNAVSPHSPAPTSEKNNSHQHDIILEEDDNLSFQKYEKPLVLISSGEAFTNWRLLVTEQNQCAQDQYVQYQRLQDQHSQYQRSKTPNIQDRPQPTDLNPADIELSSFNYLTFGKRLTQTLQDLDLTCVRIEHLDTDEVWRGVACIQSNYN